ncbi:MAG TPA: class I SAM-dependent methyltransferase [Gemmataceae bacterium]|nr:class I SAM-dependent methyltransferase [Gemmataceae bacterium]
MPAVTKPDYGVDAPGVVRNLALVAAAGLLAFVSAAAGLWSGSVLGIPMAGIGLGFAISCGITAALMVYGSKVGKVRGRERLLDLLPWRGDEQVLDVGCGRGLLLIAAARRLTTGRAIGVDIWQTEDLSGNRPDATLENARLEGVAERVEVRTADMRELPFPDAAFDTVVSSWAVHNLYDPQDREKALREIARVLKSRGRLLLRDIKHGGEYAAVLKSAGLEPIRRADNRALSLLAMIWTFGGVRPVVLLAEKPPGPA